MDLEDLKERLETEVESYNELIDQMNELDAERQNKMARIQVLQELVIDKAKEPAEGVKTDKAEG